MNEDQSPSNIYAYGEVVEQDAEEDPLDLQFDKRMKEEMKQRLEVQEQLELPGYEFHHDREDLNTSRFQSQNMSRD